MNPERRMCVSDTKLGIELCVGVSDYSWTDRRLRQVLNYRTHLTRDLSKNYFVFWVSLNFGSRSSHWVQTRMHFETLAETKIWKNSTVNLMSLKHHLLLLLNSCPAFYFFLRILNILHRFFVEYFVIAFQYNNCTCVSWIPFWSEKRGHPFFRLVSSSSILRVESFSLSLKESRFKRQWQEKMWLEFLCVFGWRR